MTDDATHERRTRRSASADSIAIVARKQVVSRIRGTRPAGQGREASPRRGPLLSLRYRGRAAALRSVVREDGAACGTGAAAPIRDGTADVHSRIPGRRTTPRWLENIRDWCISRQLWWGHRIPVWYCDDRRMCDENDGDRGQRCRRDAAQRSVTARCGRTRTCSTPGSRRGWCRFSSLGWPDERPTCARSIPAPRMVTAPEILFFWVSRMIMAGIEFMGERAVHDRSTCTARCATRSIARCRSRLATASIRLEVIDRYGADALRYTVVSGMSVGTDLILDPADLDTSFASGPSLRQQAVEHRPLPARPPRAAVARAVHDRSTPDADARRSLDPRARPRDAIACRHRQPTNDSGSTKPPRAIYHFLWSDFADWYLEQIKPRLYGTQPGGDVARAVAAHVFDVALRLLHPVMPFITETLWQRLPNHAADASISVAPWPVAGDARRDEAAERPNSPTCSS